MAHLFHPDNLDSYYHHGRIRLVCIDHYDTEIHSHYTDFLLILHILFRLHRLGNPLVHHKFHANQDIPSSNHGYILNEYNKKELVDNNEIPSCIQHIYDIPLI